MSNIPQENRAFPPPEEFRRKAIITNDDIYQQALKDPDKYWSECAERISWYRRWDTVTAWNHPFAQWFAGGKLNVCYNCVDRHVEAGHGNRIAFLWEDENNSERAINYSEALASVIRLALVYRKLGIKKGDRVAIYMPMTPEAIYAMLACARIGAIHTVVFGGFSSNSLRERIIDAGAKLIVTTDGIHRRGAIIPLKKNVDEALADCPSVESALVFQHANNDVSMLPGRDHWYHSLAEKVNGDCPPESMDSEDILFILYTSGTTGKPKGIVHTTGGYIVNAAETTRIVFDLRPDDIFWCTADVGWITGHSYIAYGPMANCATQIIYEGAPDYPRRDRFWQLIEKYRATILYTAPTAIRAFMKWGTTWPSQHKLSSLRLLGTVGEPINPEAWMWYHQNIGEGRCPIVDTWWQTETGAIMISPLPGITTTYPGSATRPLPGISVAIMDENGKQSEQGSGYLGITKPWPSMLRGIWGDEQRYRDTYWSKYPGVYFAGDGAIRDNNGNIWLMGRVDDIMLVSGHNISTTEVESALVAHDAVAEAAVVGASDSVTGQAIVAFVTLREGREENEDTEQQLKSHVAQTIGHIARPRDIVFTVDLPKTRSGKIMRRLLRDLAEGRPTGDVTTLANPNILEKIRQHYKK